MRNIHYHYDQLTHKERNLIDACFQMIFKMAKEDEVRLKGDDTAEHAVDALAKAIIESRK